MAEKSSNPSLSQDILWNVDLEAFSVKKQKKLRMIEYPADDNSSLSVETLALIRDSKRRRKSYRGVHTARRSYIEVNFMLSACCHFSLFNIYSPEDSPHSVRIEGLRAVVP
ncbi:hypothetical protein FBUS_04739 [Fasciolopsis buskii]|uniref:Uncharacterized protein n=1 Tax=Fasciolopsis buskii TaxID=27845 RepID=A0A8E0RKI8_9TREM|nr:hypothetical protein FBUS_04739 [Fasciolopsis buski]